MKCLNPLILPTPFFKKSSEYDIKGFRSFAFEEYLKGNKDYSTYFHRVACGKCYYCKRKYVNDIVNRVLVSVLASKYPSYFVTLTYRDEDVPYVVNSDTGECRHTLVKEHIHKYQMRLNRYCKYHGIPVPKYFGCGEYGEQYGRPHYHLIVIGFAHDPMLLAKSLWKYQDIEFNLVSQVNYGRIRYCCKYVSKDCVFPHGVTPPFYIRSHGLGVEYITPRKLRYYTQSLDTHWSVNGYTSSLPRYLRDKLFNDSNKIVMGDDYFANNEEDFETRLKELKKLGFLNFIDEEEQTRNFFKNKQLNEILKKRKK